MHDETHREEATSYVRELKAFYQHLTTYIIVNIVLVIINLLVNPHHMWFYWITIFWGLAVLAQAIRLFGPNRKLNKKWEKKKVDQYMDKNPNDSTPKDKDD
ncbi:MAG: histidine kinase [Coxiella sp. (in: Bacteria)]|nr:MAG: histidine kinase [Coxiella sp. (in: g-proteobacteria)]